MVQKQKRHHNNMVLFLILVEFSIYEWLFLKTLGHSFNSLLKNKSIRILEDFAIIVLYYQIGVITGLFVRLEVIACDFI